MAIYIAVAAIVLIIVLLALRRATRAGEPRDTVQGVSADEAPEPVNRGDPPR
jgi:hypothetical protein